MVSYSSVKRDVKDGDVFAFTGHGLISTLIRLRTSSRYTHVGIACHALGHLCVLEAREGKGVRIFPMEKYLRQGHEITWLELESERYGIKRANVVEYAAEKLGNLYASPWQFLRSWGLISSRLADRYGLPKDTDAERFFCSEFVLSALRHGGYMGEGFDEEPAKTTPGDVVALPCLNNRGKVNF